MYDCISCRVAWYGEHITNVLYIRVMRWFLHSSRRWTNPVSFSAFEFRFWTRGASHTEGGHNESRHNDRWENGRNTINNNTVRSCVSTNVKVAVRISHLAYRLVFLCPVSIFSCYRFAVLFAHLFVYPTSEKSDMTSNGNMSNQW